MFCKYCGKQINDDALFCPYCGTKDVSTEAQTSINTTVSDSGVDNVGKSRISDSTDSKGSAKNKTRIHKIVFISLAGIVIVFLALLFYIHASNQGMLERREKIRKRLLDTYWEANFIAPNGMPAKEILIFNSNQYIEGHLIANIPSGIVCYLDAIDDETGHLWINEDKKNEGSIKILDLSLSDALINYKYDPDKDILTLETDYLSEPLGENLHLVFNEISYEEAMEEAHSIQIKADSYQFLLE